MLRARITRLQQDSHGGIRVRRIRAIRVPVLILGIRSMSPRYARQGARPYAKLETPPENAGMAKLADAADLKSAGAKSPVGVRFPLPAPAKGISQRGRLDFRNASSTSESSKSSTEQTFPRSAAPLHSRTARSYVA